MSLVLAVFVVVVFAATIEWIQLPDHAREVGRRGMDCMHVLGDSSLDDDAKEHALQRHARRLFVLLGLLTGGSVLALGLPLAVVWILESMGLASFDAVLNMLQRIDFLVGTMVVGLVGYLLIRQFRTA